MSVFFLEIQLIPSHATEKFPKQSNEKFSNSESRGIVQLVSKKKSPARESLSFNWTLEIHGNNLQYNANSFRSREPQFNSNHVKSQFLETSEKILN